MFSFGREFWSRLGRWKMIPIRATDRRSPGRQSRPSMVADRRWGARIFVRMEMVSSCRRRWDRAREEFASPESKLIASTALRFAFRYRLTSASTSIIWLSVRAGTTDVRPAADGGCGRAEPSGWVRCRGSSSPSSLQRLDQRRPAGSSMGVSRMRDPGLDPAASVLPELARPVTPMQRGVGLPCLAQRSPAQGVARDPSGHGGNRRDGLRTSRSRDHRDLAAGCIKPCRSPRLARSPDATSAGSVFSFGLRPQKMIPSRPVINTRTKVPVRARTIFNLWPIPGGTSSASGDGLLSRRRDRPS